MSEHNEINDRLRKMRSTRYQQMKVQVLIDDAVKKALKEHEDEMAQLLATVADAMEEKTLASNMKSQFLASMSHELRSPLHAIIGFLDMILQGIGFEGEPVIDPTVREYLEHVLERAKGLLSLVNNLLDLSKIEAGRMALVPMDVNVRGLTESLYREYSVLAQQKGIELKYVVDEQMPETIRIDVEKVRTIIVNLVANAIKFTEQGAVEMAFLRDGERWKIRVADTGIGFDTARERELWEPFVQLEGGTSRPYGGTGLGMPLVKHMMEMLGGEVQIASEIGKGSTFTVTLPTLMGAPG